MPPLLPAAEPPPPLAAGALLEVEPAALPLDGQALPEAPAAPLVEPGVVEPEPVEAERATPPPGVPAAEPDPAAPGAPVDDPGVVVLEVERAALPPGVVARGPAPVPEEAAELVLVSPGLAAGAVLPDVPAAAGVPRAGVPGVEPAVVLLGAAEAGLGVVAVGVP